MVEEKHEGEGGIRPPPPGKIGVSLNLKCELYIKLIVSMIAMLSILNNTIHIYFF